MAMIKAARYMYKKNKKKTSPHIVKSVCVCVSYVNQLSFNLPVVENLLVTLSSTTAYI